MLKQFFYKYKNQERLLGELYKDINGARLSKQDRGSVCADDFSLVYGEVIFKSFLELLELAHPKKNDVFYDLGSGTGKAVIAAALTQPFSKCVGIELLPSLYKASESVLSHMSQEFISKIEFIHGDLFDLDISKADIVFINGTGFFGEAFDALQHKLETLKSGSRIIITSKTLKNFKQRLLHQDLHLMSWGWAQVSIYQKQS